MAAGRRTLPRISFEFFPPKSPRASMALWTAVERLAPLGPEFVSVTYGAGGTTRDSTLAAIQAIRERARLAVAGHLTCVGATKRDVLDVARAYAKLGCRRIVALRGDAPRQSGPFAPHPGGFSEGSGVRAKSVSHEVPRPEPKPRKTDEQVTPIEAEGQLVLDFENGDLAPEEQLELFN